MHECPKDGCTRRVSTEMLACRSHWYQVTPATRRRVWSAYQSGDTDAHHKAIVDAIREMNSR